MASVLQIEQLTKAFGERLLFEGLTLHLDEGEKVALVAVNGAGKSTLLNIIAGREDYQAGQITFRRDLKVGYLLQNPTFKAGQCVLEACLDGNNKAAEAITRYERALTTGNGLEEAMAAMDAADAWDCEQQAKEVLTRLAITDFTQPVDYDYDIPYEDTDSTVEFDRMGCTARVPVNYLRRVTITREELYD